MWWSNPYLHSALVAVILILLSPEELVIPQEGHCEIPEPQRLVVSTNPVRVEDVCQGTDSRRLEILLGYMRLHHGNRSYTIAPWHGVPLRIGYNARLDTFFVNPYLSVTHPQTKPCEYSNVDGSKIVLDVPVEMHLSYLDETMSHRVSRFEKPEVCTIHAMMSLFK